MIRRGIGVAACGCLLALSGCSDDGGGGPGGDVALDASGDTRRDSHADTLPDGMDVPGIDGHERDGEDAPSDAPEGGGDADAPDLLPEIDAVDASDDGPDPAEVRDGADTAEAEIGGDGFDGADGDGSDGEVTGPALATCPLRTLASYGGADAQWSPRVGATPDGGILVFSTFVEELTLGGAVTGSLAGNGLRELFLAEVDEDGAPQWAEAYGSSGFERPMALATRGDGAVAVAATGSASFGFGDVAIGDHVVALLDGDGAPLWESEVQVNGSTDALAVTADGDVVGAGAFSGEGNLGGEVVSADGHDAYVMRWSGVDGEATLVAQLGGAGQAYASAIAEAPNGDLVVGGRFTEELVIGDTTLTTTGFLEGYVARIDADGQPVWVLPVGSADGSDSVTDLAVAPDGTLLIAADTEGAVSVGEAEVDVGQPGDLLLARLSADGEALWTWTPGGDGRTWAGRLAVDEAGGIRLAGTYEGELAFDGPMEAAPEVAELSRVFVVEMDPGGVPLCARTAGSPGEDFSSDVALDSCGRTVVGVQHMGDLASGGVTAPAAGDWDAGLLVLDQASCP